MRDPAKQALILGLVAIAAAGCGSEATEEGYASLDEALADATQLGKPVLVDFYTAW